MRRSILHAAAGLAAALTLFGCSQNETLTAPAASNAAALLPPPLGPLPPRPPRPSPEDFSDITAGRHFTCARKNNSKVFCWGMANFAQTGYYGTRTCSSTACEDRPKVVMHGVDTLRAVTIDAGNAHVCIIDSLSDAWCWGDGSQGQLGYNAGIGGANAPVIVPGGIKFTSLGVGSNSTCGIATTGLFCWGRIENNANAPVQKTNDPSLLSGMIVGDLHACFFETYPNNGRALDCWGNNTLGQVGIDQSWILNAPFAVRAQFGQALNRAATEFNVTCVDQSNGTVQCAGENTWGMLGNGLAGTGYSTGVPQTVGGGMQLHGVTTGSVHACALDAAAHAWCWGNGFNGQLGNGASAVFSTPQPVAGGITFRSIAAGAQHTCGIGTDNHIYCWGQNGYGQLGGGFSGSWYWTPQMAIDP
jgi:alpha-tubulin suppressor-like RCC1 family protein